VFKRQTPKSVEKIPCGLFFRSIGRKSAPLVGVPYDSFRGIHVNIAGRVAQDQTVVPGLYVCGWSKRGPTGTIGTNRGCAMESVEAILVDLPKLAKRRSSDANALLARLGERVEHVVSYVDWTKIDTAEKRRGARLGKPREKFTSVSELMAAAGHRCRRAVLIR
jgi:ferredoxin/flavodoxin---NADP+ reductase